MRCALPCTRLAIALSWLAAVPGRGTATLLQEPDPLRTELVGRGAPSAFADQVLAMIEAAAAAGLPTSALAAKALEGWAKHTRVPPEQVILVLERMLERLAAARDAVAAAGFDPPPEPVVAAAADALARGLSPEQVREVVTAASGADAAEAGLVVAASLAGQGLDRAAAAKLVRTALDAGRPPEQLLRMPRVLAELLAGGVTMAEVAQVILEHGEFPDAPGAEHRPMETPPGRTRRP